jgi:hypothetical protein
MCPLSVKKWMCGTGYTEWHYCNICNMPLSTLEKALECEESHSKKTGVAE